jgi:hypothetical protein
MNIVITRSFQKNQSFIFYIFFDLDQISLLRAHDNMKKKSHLNEKFQKRLSNDFVYEFNKT